MVGRHGSGWEARIFWGKIHFLALVKNKNYRKPCFGVICKTNQTEPKIRDILTKANSVKSSDESVTLNYQLSQLKELSH